MKFTQIFPNMIPIYVPWISNRFPISIEIYPIPIVQHISIEMSYIFPYISINRFPYSIIFPYLSHRICGFLRKKIRRPEELHPVVAGISTRDALGDCSDGVNRWVGSPIPDGGTLVDIHTLTQYIYIICMYIYNMYVYIICMYIYIYNMYIYMYMCVYIYMYIYIYV
jgi:hypothetical protein